ncbi:hypothetical protein GCM10027162_26980 [Streptomyces incanus]
MVDVGCGHDARFADALPAVPFDRQRRAGLTVSNANGSVRSSRATVEEAILHAVVHGWYEGHAQGQDECPGYDFRDGLPKDTNRG